jgi:hypothetical protein
VTVPSERPKLATGNPDRRARHSEATVDLDAVPSERDAAFSVWGAPKNPHDVGATQMERRAFEAGWDAALEAQHTRDEEARALLSEFVAIDPYEQLSDDETHDEAERCFYCAELHGRHDQTCVWNNARAYVQQSDQGEKSVNSASHKSDA